MKVVMEQGGCSEHMREISGVADTIDIDWCIDFFKYIFAQLSSLEQEAYKKQKKVPMVSISIFYESIPLPGGRGKPTKGPPYQLDSWRFPKKSVRGKREKKVGGCSHSPSSYLRR